MKEVTWNGKWIYIDGNLSLYLSKSREGFNIGVDDFYCEHINSKEDLKLIGETLIKIANGDMEII